MLARENKGKIQIRLYIHFIETASTRIINLIFEKSSVIIRMKEDPSPLCIAKSLFREIMQALSPRLQKRFIRLVNPVILCNYTKINK